jgi:putative transposase
MLGYSRGNYYKRKEEESKEAEVKELIKHLVCLQRQQLPRLGTRKLYSLIKPQLQEMGIKCGRDKLFKYLRECDLLIKQRKFGRQTTFSNHWMRKYPNIVKGKHIEYPEQVWFSDITYLKTDEGYCYLSMITDAYSRKIMGYNISDSMSADECVKALKMALKQRIYLATELIHHSDRGLQYCSKEYVETALKANIGVSMTESSSPYDNALAERMNRTIKEEFNLNRTLKTKNQAINVVNESIELYNNLRPHLSLGFFTPNDIHKNPQLLGANGDYFVY